jgi:hypothetical protein
MPLYRILYESGQPDPGLAEVIDFPSGAAVVAAARHDLDPFGVPRSFEAILPWLPEMESECVCTRERSNQVVRLRNLAYPEYPGDWQCLNCGRHWIMPHDMIVWDHERMFAAGYVPCGCEFYNVDCRCGGSGWFYIGGDDEEEE